MGDMMHYSGYGQSLVDDEPDPMDEKLARALAIIRSMQQQPAPPPVDLPRMDVPEYSGPKPWVGKAQGILDSLQAVAQAVQAGKDRREGYYPTPVTGGTGLQSFMAQREAGMAPVREAEQYNLGVGHREAEMRAESELDQANRAWSRQNVLYNSLVPYLLKDDPQQRETPETADVQKHRYLAGLPEDQRAAVQQMFFPERLGAGGAGPMSDADRYSSAYWSTLGREDAQGGGVGPEEHAALVKEAGKIFRRLTTPSQENFYRPMDPQKAMQQAWQEARQIHQANKYFESQDPSRSGGQEYGSPQFGFEAPQGGQPQPGGGLGSLAGPMFQEPPPQAVPSPPKPGRSIEMMPSHATHPWESLDPAMKIHAMRRFNRMVSMGGDKEDLSRQFYAQFGIWPQDAGLEQGM